MAFSRHRRHSSLSSVCIASACSGRLQKKNSELLTEIILRNSSTPPSRSSVAILLAVVQKYSFFCGKWSPHEHKVQAFFCKRNHQKAQTVQTALILIGLHYKKKSFFSLRSLLLNIGSFIHLSNACLLQFLPPPYSQIALFRNQSVRAACTHTHP